jgi:hypothetical protein
LFAERQKWPEASTKHLVFTSDMTVIASEGSCEISWAERNVQQDNCFNLLKFGGATERHLRREPNYIFLFEEWNPARKNSQGILVFCGF